MAGNETLIWTAFLGASSLVLLLYMLLGGRSSPLDARLKDLAHRGESPPADPVAQFARSALPKMGGPLVPRSEEDRTKLQTRLTHAGLYGRQAMPLFLGV